MTVETVKFGKSSIAALEHYVNLHTKEDIAKFADVAFQMLQETYKDIGGCGVNSAKQLIQETDLMKFQRRDGKLVAVNCYKKTPHGLKCFVGGSDGSDAGKRAMKDFLKQDFDLSGNDLRNRHKWKRRTYIEVSGAPEHILMNKFEVNVIPNTKVGEILDKEILELHKDGIHYDRMIAGTKRTKVLIGNLDFLVQ